MAGSGTPNGKPRGRDNNTIALLSLKLLLLAFFILLNAVSELEDQKVHAAVNSVRDAFNSPLRPVAGPNASTAATDIFDETKRALEEVASVFQSALNAVAVDGEVTGHRLRIELPASTLFEPDAPQLTPSGRRLLERMSRALSRRLDAGVAYRLEFLHGLPGKLDRLAPRLQEGDAFELRRLGITARYLAAQGIREDRLSIGFAAQRPQRIVLLVQILEAAATDAAARGATR